MSPSYTGNGLSLSSTPAYGQNEVANAETCGCRVAVRNTFIDIVDDGSCSAFKRSHSAPASLTQEWCAHDASTDSTEPRQKGVVHGAERHRRRKATRRQPCIPAVSLGQGGGIHRLEFIEDADKLGGSLRLLRRRFRSPIGELVLTLFPAGDPVSRGRGCGPCFQSVAGRAVGSVKCSAKPAPDAFLTLSLGDGSQRSASRHDFSKNPVCALPGALNLWAAVDLEAWTFTVVLTVVARASLPISTTS